MKTSNTVITIIVLILVVGGIYLLQRDTDNTVTPNQTATTTQSTSTDSDTAATGTDQQPDTDQSETSDQDENDSRQGVSVIGQSAGGFDITAQTYGDGDRRLLFVAGLHGGYDWNTVKLADRMMEWFDSNPAVIPDSLSVTVVPNLNPDGLQEVTGSATPDFTQADVAADTTAGRFNANNVDLNRNFDCNWQSEGRWQNRSVDAGSSAFSEPEAQALRGWVESNNPEAAVAFFSAAGAVYSSACNGEPSTASTNLMNTYAQASGYPAEGEFNAYEITGDAVDWMAKMGVPGISVLLSNHQDTEWSRNKAGVEAVLQAYSQ